MMIEVSVIHSPSRTDRRALIEQEAATQGFSIRYHPAVFSSNAKRGISQAHRNVIQFAKDNNLPWIVVLEDDCHFTRPGAFQYYLSQMPEDYDLYLGGIYIIKRINTDGTIADFSGMTCYCVHNKFFDTFLSVNKDKNIDSALWGKGKYVLCDPMVALQHQTLSDHHKTVLNNDEREPHSPSVKRFFNGRKFF